MFEASRARSQRSRSSRSSASIIDWSSARCCGVIERSSDCHRGHPLGQLLDDVVERPGAREEAGRASTRKSSTSSWPGSRPSSRSSSSEFRSRTISRFAWRSSGVVPWIASRQAVDEAVERLAPEPVGQRLEPLARGRLHEVVLLERPDPAADVARQRFELVDPPGGGVAEHLPERGVGRLRRRAVGRRRVGRLVEPALDPGPLVGDDLVELLRGRRRGRRETLVALLERVALGAAAARAARRGRRGPAGRVARRASRAPSGAGAPRRGRPRP